MWLSELSPSNQGGDSITNVVIRELLSGFSAAYIFYGSLQCLLAIFASGPFGLAYPRGREKWLSE